MRRARTGSTEDADRQTAAQRRPRRSSSTIRGSTPTRRLGHHPERPERLVAARAGRPDGAGRRPSSGSTPRPATDDELARVHDRRFIEALSASSAASRATSTRTPTSRRRASTSRGSPPARWWRMVDAMIDGPVGQGRRPPAAARAPRPARPRPWASACSTTSPSPPPTRARAALERVAVVDWDVHHGNGTQEMFWRDPSVLYVSTHQFPFYPGTGDARRGRRGRGQGLHGERAPRAPAAATRCTRARSSASSCPSLEAYAPELVLVSAGFDAAARDPAGADGALAGGVRVDGARASRASPTPRRRGQDGAGARGRLRPRGARRRHAERRRGNARRAGRRAWRGRPTTRASSEPPGRPRRPGPACS